VLPEDGVFQTETCRGLLMSILMKIQKLFLRLSNCASVGEKSLLNAVGQPPAYNNTFPLC
jgi:hypothetical protein